MRINMEVVEIIKNSSAEDLQILAENYSKLREVDDRYSTLYRLANVHLRRKKPTVPAVHYLSNAERRMRG